MKILLIVDDSENSTRAMKAVQLGTWLPGTKVFVLAVVPRHRLPPPPPPMLLALRADWRGGSDEAGRARALVGLVVEELKTGGLEAEGKVRLGHSRREILKEARERSADLLVIGSSKFTLLRWLWVGGDLASSLATRAPCSVEVIRAKEETALARGNVSDGGKLALHTSKKDRSGGAAFGLQHELEGAGEARH